MLTNKALAEAFVNGACKGKSANAFIEGNAFFSYSHDWVVAKRFFNRLMEINLAKRSKTTSTHTKLVMEAARKAEYTICKMDFTKKFI